MSCQQKICDQLSVSVSQEELSRPGPARGNARSRGSGAGDGRQEMGFVDF